jgi:hypothetical protein
MKKIIIIITCFIGLSGAFAQQREIFHNPVIEADVPDPSAGRITGNHKRLPSSSAGQALSGRVPACNIPAAKHPHIIPIQTVNLMFFIVHSVYFSGKEIRP